MKPTREDIRTRFREYNDLYFYGALPRCKISVTYISAMGCYTFDRNRRIGHIWIRKTDMTENMLRETLVHEMIHHYVKTVEGREGGLFGHNWRFRRQCRRLRKEFGLEIGLWSLRSRKD